MLGGFLCWTDQKYINIDVDTRIIAIQAKTEEEPISDEQSIVDKLYMPSKIRYIIFGE